jgi:hypothetical protein
MDITGTEEYHLLGYRSRGPGFDSPALPDFLRGSGSGTGSTQPREELLGRNSSSSGQENREYDRGDPLRWPLNTLYPQKLVLLRQEAAVTRSAYFASGRKPRSFFFSSSGIWRRVGNFLPPSFTEHKRTFSGLLLLGDGRANGNRAPAFHLYRFSLQYRSSGWKIILLATCLPAGSSRYYPSTLKTEAIGSSETSVATQRTTQCHIPEDDTLHNHRCENLKSYITGTVACNKFTTFPYYEQRHYSHTKSK